MLYCYLAFVFYHFFLAVITRTLNLKLTCRVDVLIGFATTSCTDQEKTISQYNELNNMGRLHEIHENLCHPGITRLAHFVKVGNLSYSIEEVKRVCAASAVCARWKPRFYTPEAGRLVKATQPMERLSNDFKGSLRSTSKNRYLLTVIDEYSRFPFAFACTNTNTDSVIQSLNQIFIVFGMRLISIQIEGHPSYQRKCVDISPISELLLAGQHLITPRKRSVWTV